MFDRLFRMPQVLNKPGFWIWHGCIWKGYVDFGILLIMSPYASIMPTICPNIPQYAWTWLNIAECPWICYKNPENPSCIDLILTNNPSFQNSGVIETGLFDFHKMTVTVMKTTSEKLKPNIIHYRDYRKFSNDKFRENLISRLSTENIRADCNCMEKVFAKALDELAPQKKKYSRGNNMPFINKTIKKPFEKYISQKLFR